MAAPLPPPAIAPIIAPTPAAAGLAWSDTHLQAPSTTWTWANYNIYSNSQLPDISQMNDVPLKAMQA